MLVWFMQSLVLTENQKRSRFHCLLVPLSYLKAYEFCAINTKHMMSQFGLLMEGFSMCFVSHNNFVFNSFLFDSAYSSLNCFSVLLYYKICTDRFGCPYVCLGSLSACNGLSGRLSVCLTVRLSSST